MVRERKRENAVRNLVILLMRGERNDVIRSFATWKNRTLQHRSRDDLIRRNIVHGVDKLHAVQKILDRRKLQGAFSTLIHISKDVETFEKVSTTKATTLIASVTAKLLNKLRWRALNQWRSWNIFCKEKQLSCLHILFATANKKRSVSLTRSMQRWIQHTMCSRIQEKKMEEVKKQKLLAFVRALNSRSIWAMSLKVAMAFGKWRSHVECDNVLYFHMQSKATQRVAEAFYSHGLRRKMKAMSKFQIATAVARERDKYQRMSSSRRIALAIIHHRKRALMYGMWKLKQFGNVLHVHERRRKEHGTAAVMAVLGKWSRKQLLRSLNQ